MPSWFVKLLVVLSAAASPVAYLCGMVVGEHLGRLRTQELMRMELSDVQTEKYHLERKLKTLQECNAPYARCFLNRLWEVRRDIDDAYPPDTIERYLPEEAWLKEQLCEHVELGRPHDLTAVEVRSLGCPSTNQ